jgi:hypothetical protein
MSQSRPKFYEEVPLTLPSQPVPVECIHPACWGVKKSLRNVNSAPIQPHLVHPAVANYQHQSTASITQLEAQIQKLDRTYQKDLKSLSCKVNQLKVHQTRQQNIHTIRENLQSAVLQISKHNNRKRLYKLRLPRQELELIYDNDSNLNLDWLTKSGNVNDMKNWLGSCLKINVAHATGVADFKLGEKILAKIGNDWVSSVVINMKRDVGLLRSVKVS